MHDTQSWIRANAIALTSVEAGNGFADLAPLRKVIGDARIVSLGEATHGTREFFQLKHRLLEYCVSELGFTIFGIEASYPECLRINDYVLDGKGDPADALASQRFWTWDTQEVLAQIEWMRGWNARNARKVKFYGFDMQFPSEAALGALAYLEGVAPALAADLEKPLWPLIDDFAVDYLHLLPQSTREAALAATTRLLAAFDAERPVWAARTGQHAWAIARLNATVLDQAARMRIDLATGSTNVRDLSMADNVAALLALEGPDAKAVLWSHNGHAARDNGFVEEDAPKWVSMGSRLHDLFGPKHIVVGFAFNQGSFQAMEGERGLVDHTVPPAPEGSLDHALATVGPPTLLLDLRTAPAQGPANDWLAAKPLTRCIGAAFSAKDADKYVLRQDPRRAYDILAFVDTTTAARGNVTGRRQTPMQPDPPPAPAAQNLALAGSDSVPDGWTAPHYHRKHGHTLALADERTAAGGRTVQIARETGPWTWGGRGLEQTFAAGPWRGQRVAFSAAVRVETKAPGAGAHLYIEAKPKAPEGQPWNPANAVALLDRPMRESRWQTCRSEIDVPQDADTLTIGMAFAGDGAAWFGDLAFAVV